MQVSWDDDIPNIWKINKCSKPPTSYIQYYILKYQKIVDHFQKHISWDDDIPNIWKINKCSKPPTSYILYIEISKNSGSFLETY